MAIKFLWLGGKYDEIPEYLKPSLNKSGWVDSTGQLTLSGKNVAMIYISFKEQIDILGLTSLTVNLPKYSALVEEDAAQYFSEQGYRVQFDEGASITALPNACWRAFVKKFDLYEKYKASRPKHSSYIEIHIENYDEHEAFLSLEGAHVAEALKSGLLNFRSLWDGMKSLQKSDVYRGLEDQARYRYKRYPHYFSRNNVDFTVDLFDRLDSNQLLNILKYWYFNKRPSSGFPDLTCLTKYGVQLIEVKTTDKLTKRQIERFPTLIACGFNLSVVRVIRTEET